MTDFPSSVSARKCLRDGDCGDVVFDVLRRTLTLNAALRLVGEKKNRLSSAFAGSLAVQAFVMAWTATHMDEPKASLPSGEAALQGSASEIVGTWLARSAIIGTGLWLGGTRKHLLRNALTGSALIQVSVLIWAAQEKES